MAKSIFRYLRGEINGYYLNNIHNTVEKEVTDIKDFFTDFYNQQFQLDKISSKTLFNIGKFASVFLPRRPLSESTTSIYMSESKVVDDTEFSERGLYNIENEKFNFYHLNLNSYGVFYFKHTSEEETEDINTLSSPYMKSSLIGDESLLGYVSESVTNLYNSDGTIDMSKVTENPPENVAYNRVYGDNFSVLSEGEDTDLDLNIRIVLTESDVVEGTEYSERGLYKPPVLNYEDINKLATEKERSSLVGDEEVLGYISENAEDVLDDSGKVRISKVSTTTPTSGAYSDYYGNTFLYLSEGETSYVAIDSPLYIELYKAIQYIRYNGVSIKSLCNVISVLCPSGLVKIDHIDISLNSKYIYVYYNYNNNVDVTYKEQRLSLLEYLINLKYKQILLVENNTQE